MTGRAARMTLRAFVAVVVAGGALAVTPSLAGAQIRPPSPVGSVSAAAASPRLAVGSGGVRSLTAQAATCTAAEAFSRVSQGGLYRLVDSAPISATTNTMTETGQIGTGWSGNAFAWTGAGGDGVLYALTWTGQLRWYRWNSTSSGWASGSGRVIGSGFTPRTKVRNFALGGDGRFYVVKPDGKLFIYRHTGRLTGAGTWANSSGWLIGSGWTGNDILIPNGDGTLYRQAANGILYWYRHTDPEAGAVRWSTTKKLGTGWRFYDVLSVGGGVLYATQGGTGQVRVYQHLDPTGGSSAWANSSGVLKTTARPDSFGIAVDPMACSTPS